MKQSFASMGGSKAAKKAMRNCIAKTSSWGCSKVRMPHEYLPPNWRDPGVRKRGFDTSQLAAG